MKFSGTATQFRFAPPLRSGKHVLSFNRKVKDDVFLLFDAALTSELLLLRADDGVEVPVGASGERHIKAGDAYTVGLRIRDPVSGELICVFRFAGGHAVYQPGFRGPRPPGMNECKGMIPRIARNRSLAPKISVN